MLASVSFVRTVYGDQPAGIAQTTVGMSVVLGARVAVACAGGAGVTCALGNVTGIRVSGVAVGRLRVVGDTSAMAVGGVVPDSCDDRTSAESTVPSATRPITRPLSNCCQLLPWVWVALNLTPQQDERLAARM
jgi:hypothetical protein